MKEQIEKTGTLVFDLTTRDGRESMKNALEADILKHQIDCLYENVFRKYFKHNAPLEGRQELQDYELKVIELIWEEVREHFEL